jgi:hypothetical protein
MLVYECYVLSCVKNLLKTAATGKNGEGDTLGSPTACMEYGFAEFDASGNVAKPSWVKTFSRETHADASTRWMEKVEYSDGMVPRPSVRSSKAA